MLKLLATGLAASFLLLPPAQAARGHAEIKEN